MGKTLYGFAAAAIMAATASAMAVQRTESIPLGAAPVAAYADAPSGKVFVAGEGRSRNASLAVLERGGRLSTLPIEPAPVALAGSPRLRRLVIVHAGGTASVVHLDTLKATAVPVSGAPSRVVISERANEAYVLARQGRDAVVTAIDLKTLATRAGVVRDLAAIAMAVEPSGHRLYLLGTHPDDDAAYVQPLEIDSMLAATPATRLGRVPRDIAVTAAGDAVVVLDHAEGKALRPALRLLDPSLVPLRTVLLPEARYSDTAGTLQGDLLLDPATGLAWVRDAANARILIVNLVAATVSATDLEAEPSSIALNAAAGTALAVMASTGQAAVLSAAGERLDTLTVGHASTANVAPAIAVDGDSGDAYVGHAADAALTVLPRAPEGAVVANLTDLWTDPAQPGEGLFVEQQSTTAFAALFTYGGGGDASWLVMSNGARQPDGAFSGVLFRTQGPSHPAASNVTPVGIMRILPTAEGVSVTYVVDGSSTTRRLQRFAAGKAAPACRWTAADGEAPPLARANFTALWSNPVDPGWGIAVSHHRQAVFAVLFTYDDQNRPTWMVMSDGRQQAPGQFTGALYRISRSKLGAIGSMTLRFGAADEGSVGYRMDGTDFRAPLLRQRFAPLVSRCGG